MRAALGQCFVEPFSHDRLFVSVLDLRSAFLAVERRLVLLAGALIFFAAKCAQGKVTRRPVAGVEMLMPPLFRWYDHAVFMPGVLFDRRAVGHFQGWL